MYSSYYTKSPSLSLVDSDAASIWVIISLILALVGGIIAYFLFVRSKKTNPSNKFLVWLKTFLRFDQMMIEDIIKIAYLILAIFITLSSFATISSSFLAFLCTLVFGNIILRVGFEFAMLMIMIWRNTADIRKKLDGDSKKDLPEVAPTAAPTSPSATTPEDHEG